MNIVFSMKIRGPVLQSLVILSSLSGHLLPPKDEGAGQHHHQGPWLLQTGRYQGEIKRGVQSNRSDSSLLYLKTLSVNLAEKF